MSKRQRLTAKLCKQLKPPEVGEIWIPDTIIKGFGIRLWGGKTKGKSFAIRLNDRSGKTVRISIGQAQYMSLRIARKLAAWEINRIKPPRKLKQKPLSTKEKILAEWKLKTEEISLDQLANLSIEVKKLSAKSSHYLNETLKRYYLFLPKDLGKRLLKTLSADEIFSVVSILNNRPGQQRNLRTFLVFMLSIAFQISSNFRQLYFDFKNYKIEPYRESHNDFGQSYTLEAKHFDELFKILKKEKVFTQQANFIQLLFWTGIPSRPSRLLKSKWEEFGILSRSRYPRLYKPEVVIWQPKQRSEFKTYARQRHLSDGAKEFLLQIKDRNELEFPGSPYVFPSKSAKGGYMTSYKIYWASIKDKTGLPDLSLKKLVENHWHAVSFRNYYLTL